MERKCSHHAENCHHHDHNKKTCCTENPCIADSCQCSGHLEEDNIGSNEEDGDVVLEGEEEEFLITDEEILHYLLIKTGINKYKIVNYLKKIKERKFMHDTISYFYHYYPNISKKSLEIQYEVFKNWYQVKYGVHIKFQDFENYHFLLTD